MIDTHAHLDALDDPKDAVERARAAGVTRIVAIGSGAASTRATLAIAQGEEGVSVAAGPSLSRTNVDRSGEPHETGERAERAEDVREVPPRSAEGRG